MLVCLINTTDVLHKYNICCINETVVLIQQVSHKYYSCCISGTVVLIPQMSHKYNRCCISEKKENVSMNITHTISKPINNLIYCKCIHNNLMYCVVV